MKLGIIAVVAAVAMVAVLGGCETHGGFKFVVTADPALGVDQVRMYVGIKGGTRATITPRGFAPTARPEGTYWVLDTTAIDDRTFPADGSYSFAYPADDDVRKISVIAVGLADGRPVAKAAAFELKVEAGVVKIYDLVLAPTTAASAASTAPDETFLWGPEDDPLGCVYAKQPDAGFPLAYLVRADDLDCDGVIGPDECDPTWADARTTPTRATLDCLDRPDVMVPQGQAKLCLVGRVGCDEVEIASGGSSGGCNHATPYCAPAELCEGCAGLSAVDAFACMFDPENSAQSQLGVYCPVAVQRDSLTGELTLCEQVLVPDDPADGAPTFPHACAAAAPVFRDATMTSWSSTPVIGNVTFGFEEGAGCARITPTIPAGTVVDALAFPTGMHRGLVSIDLANGRGLVYPLILSLEDRGCDAQSLRQLCSTVLPPNTASLYTCLEFAPVGI